jgi:hypothetical protein
MQMFISHFSYTKQAMYRILGIFNLDAREGVGTTKYLIS